MSDPDVARITDEVVVVLQRPAESETTSVAADESDDKEQKPS